MGDVSVRVRCGVAHVWTGRETATRHRPFAPSSRLLIAVPSPPSRSARWTRLALALTPRTCLDQRDLDEARDLLGRLP